jgi:hypothetical protein
MQLSEQFKVALARAAYGGVLAAAVVFLAAYSQTNQVKSSLLAGAGALLSYLAARGGAEGYIDTQAKLKA